MTAPKLAGRVCLVTGAGRGIGRAVALKLASEGATLVLNDLDKEPLEDTVAAVRDMGVEAVGETGSVTDASFPLRFVARAVDGFGGVDIIVNNAGYILDAVIQNMSDQAWEEIIEVHLSAPFRILRAAAPHIRSAAKAEAEKGIERFRKIVNISSVAGLSGNAGQVNYSAAKAGIVGLTKALAKEWGRYRVNVNAVAFGMIGTRFISADFSEGTILEVAGHKVRAGLTPEMADFMRRNIPLGRAGTPDEAAGAVYLLCIPESDYISGQVLVCAGGLSF